MKRDHIVPLFPSAGALLCLMAFAMAAGCSVEDAEPGGTTTTTSSSDSTQPGSEVRRIQIDGSSTVEKITSAVAEKFEGQFPDVQVPVKVTGTGTGFKEMIAGRIDIANASRAVKDSEKADCQKNGIELLEVKIALDGMAVCVSPENTWCDAVTVAELHKIWAPDSTVRTWKDVRPEWPDEPIRLYGAGEESGTFDYFTEVINGKEDAMTENYSPSADDNVILTGVAGDKYAMGFFGCSFYFLNTEKVKALKISPTENVADAVELTPETVTSGAYKPMSRPLFIYVKKSSLTRPEVADFVRFYLNDGQSEVAAVKYVPLSPEEIGRTRDAFEQAVKSPSVN
jgi:phosphate transport system substrate-binding protein